jgi:hypothetical protein
MAKGGYFMAEAEACADHSQKMCNMTCCPCHLDLEKLKPLVRNPKFICKACGRVAADEKNICDPDPLN